MRWKLPVWLVVLLLAVIPASGRPGPDSNYNTSIASGGTPTWTPLTAVCQTAGFTNTVTFTGVTLATGLIVLGVTDDQFKSYATATATINGNAATQIQGVTGAGLFSANNTGTSGSVVITETAGNFDAMCISVGVLTNLNSSTATASTSSTYADTQNQPYALGSTLTVNSGGIGVVFMGVDTGGQTAASLPLSWTGATRDAVTEVNTTAGNSASAGMAHFTTSANPTVSCATACNFLAVGVAAGAWR